MGSHCLWGSPASTKNETPRRKRMTRRISPSLLFVLCLTCLGLTTSTLAQNAPATPPRARYAVLPAHLHPAIAPPPASLQSSNGSFTYSGTNYTYNMVGAAPSSN